MQLPLFKTCSQCGQTKFITEFVKHHRQKDGHTNLCKPCSKAYLSDYNSKRAKTIQKDTKQCTICHETKSINEFRKDKNRPDGHFPYCKRCTTKDVQVYEKRKQGLKHCSDCDQWLEPSAFYPNSDKLSSQCRECTKERARDWKNVNPEAYKERNRRIAWDNPEERKARFRAYYAANTESQRQRVLAYSKTPAGKAHQARQNHKRRMWVSASPATLTSDEWTTIIEAQGNKCNICGREFGDHLKPTRDHIIPVSKGGSLSKDNTQALCKSCNSRKGNR